MVGVIAEMWKPVPGTNGKLEVSHTGKVRSLLRDKRTLRTQKDHKGYARVTVSIKGEKRTYKVHRLVAQAFILNPECKSQVNHIDGDKQNNHVDNLEWNTARENVMHAINSGLFKTVYEGSARENERRKKPIIGYNRITGEHEYFESVSKAERRFDSRHISDVLKGNRSSVKGWTFRYAEGVST